MGKFCYWGTGDNEIHAAKFFISYSVTHFQCVNIAIFPLLNTETCCDVCGPHLTTTTPTTTSTAATTPTTTPVCEDTLSNCADLAEEDVGCYDWETQCCESCRDKIIDYLPEDCK